MASSELRALRDSLADSFSSSSAPASAPASSAAVRWRSIAALAFVVGAALGLVFAPTRETRERDDEDPLFQPF